jgi:hypothetical protein
LRRKAGEQLAKLLSAQGANGQVFVKDVFCENDTVVAQLIDILVQDKECQISAAAILEHLCCHFVRYNELSELCVVKLLRMVNFYYFLLLKPLTRINQMQLYDT